jgi:hypothetical protein
MWSVNLFLKALRRLQRVTVHLGIPRPNDLLQRTVKDFTIKIHILARDLERAVLGPVDDDDGDDGGLDGSSSDSDGGAPPVATTST